MRRPRPKFIVSFYLYFCCFWINVTQINFENIKSKIQRIISDSCFQLILWFNVDARAPSIPLLNFPFKKSPWSCTGEWFLDSGCWQASKKNNVLTSKQVSSLLSGCAAVHGAALWLTRRKELINDSGGLGAAAPHAPPAPRGLSTVLFYAGVPEVKVSRIHPWLPKLATHKYSAHWLIRTQL